MNRILRKELNSPEEPKNFRKVDYIFDVMTINLNALHLCLDNQVICTEIVTDSELETVIDIIIGMGSNEAVNI